MKLLNCVLIIMMLSSCLTLREKIGSSIIKSTIRTVPTLRIKQLDTIKFTLPPIDLFEASTLSTLRDSLILNDSITGTNSTVYVETSDSNCIGKVEYQLKVIRGKNTTDTLTTIAYVDKFVLDPIAKNKIEKLIKQNTRLRVAILVTTSLIITLLLIAWYKLSSKRAFNSSQV